MGLTLSTFKQQLCQDQAASCMMQAARHKLQNAGRKPEA